VFADAHRAIGDCQASLYILSLPFGAEGKPALSTLLANARETTIRNVAERDLEAELAFLRASVFLRPVDLPTQRITARERYSANAPS
jgi:hypothetical protein